MSAGPTLNSRLRVLVAKAFKAEKLYASIRNQTVADPSRSISSDPADAGGEKNPSGSATLSVFANDVRAKEWQRSHFQLRTALNEILSESAGARTVQELVELRDRFGAKAAECTGLVERETGELLEIAKRKEFAHCLKLALDLVRHNARAQAYSVIVSELNGILDSAPLQPQKVQPHQTAQQKNIAQISPENRSKNPPMEAVRNERESNAGPELNAGSDAGHEGAAVAASNVIPFSRRAVSGRRR